MFLVKDKSRDKMLEHFKEGVGSSHASPSFLTVKQLPVVIHIFCNKFAISLLNFVFLVFNYYEIIMCNWSCTVIWLSWIQFCFNKIYIFIMSLHWVLLSSHWG